MKQAQFKSIVTLIILFTIMALIVAANTIELNFPVNDEWDTSSDNSVDFNFTANMTTGVTIAYCALYANNSGTFELKANYTSGLVNATPHVAGIAINDSARFGAYGWNVTCNNGTADFFTTIVGLSAGTTASFGVDGNTPSVILDSPVGGIYLPNLNDTLFLFTVTDTSNADTALFYHNISGTFAVNETIRPYTSGTQVVVNISSNADDHTTTNILDGTYIWNV